MNKYRSRVLPGLAALAVVVLALVLPAGVAAQSITLRLDDNSLGEAGESTTVTAELGAATTQMVTLRVSAAPVAPATASDYEFPGGRVLQIVPGETTSTGTEVSIRTVPNNVDEPNKSVTISATVTAGGLTAPDDITLTITDDDSAPRVVLAPTDREISENGGTTRVTARLSHPSAEATTVTVTPVAGHYTVGTEATLTIPAYAMTSTGSGVTITAVDDRIDNMGVRSELLTGSAMNNHGVAELSGEALRLADDDGPTVTLMLTPNPVVEGGVTTVTATLSRPLSERLRLTVSASAVAPTKDDAFAFGRSRVLIFEPTQTDSTGTVTITLTENTVDSDERMVTVSATAPPDVVVTGPADQILGITDNDQPPEVTLALSPATLGAGSGGSARVTASLSHPTVEDVTLTVSAMATGNAVDGDFILGTEPVLTIPAGRTASAGHVTITEAVAGLPTRGGQVLTIEVSAVVSSTRGITDPESVNLQLTPGLPRGFRQRGIERSVAEMAAVSGWQRVEVIGDHASGADPSDPRITLTNPPDANPADGATSQLSDFLESGAEFSLLLAPPPSRPTNAPLAHENEGLLRLWGRGAASSASFDSPAGRTEKGNIRAGFLGIDSTQPSGLVFGVALGWHRASLEFSESVSGPDPLATGTSGIDLWSLNPYVSFSSAGTRLWGSLGIGSGDFNYAETPGGEAALPQRSTSSSLSMQSLAGGIAQEFGRMGQFDMVGRGDGMVSLVKVDGVSHSHLGYNGFRTTNYGARGEVEFGMPTTVDDVRVRPFGTAGVRLDSGDSEVGSSAEIGVGVTIKSASLTADGEIRKRIGLDGDFDLTGYSFTFGYDLADDQQGIQLDVAQFSGPSELDLDDVDPLSPTSPLASRRGLDIRAGYGFGVRESLLTPFATASWNGAGLSRAGGGIEFAGPVTSFGLGYQVNPSSRSSNGRDEHTVRAHARIDLGR